MLLLWSIDSKGVRVSRINSTNFFGNIKSFGELLRFLTGYTDELTSIVNGNLEFGLNIKAFMINSEFNTVEKTFNHTLGRVPIGFLVIGNNTNTAIYDGPTKKTATTISLKAGGSCTATILVI